MVLARRVRVALLASAVAVCLLLGLLLVLGSANGTPDGEVAGLIGEPIATTLPPASPGLAAASPARPRSPDPIGERSVAARRPVAPTTLTGYVWPLPRSRLTLPFGPSPWGSRVVDGEPFHDGIDLATFCGDRVVAAHDGTVLTAGRRYDAFVGWVGDLSPYMARLDEKQLWTTLPIVVVIDDGNEYRSIYAHFRDVVVKAGDVVTAGQLLGYEGKTGRASGCHLHYGLFSPFETRTFAIREDVVGRMLVPDRQIARVDPLLVLLPMERAGIR